MYGDSSSEHIVNLAKRCIKSIEEYYLQQKRPLPSGGVIAKHRALKNVTPVYRSEVDGCQYDQYTTCSDEGYEKHIIKGSLQDSGQTSFNDFVWFDPAHMPDWRGRALGNQVRPPKKFVDEALCYLSHDGTAPGGPEWSLPTFYMLHKDCEYPLCYSDHFQEVAGRGCHLRGLKIEYFKSFCPDLVLRDGRYTQMNGCGLYVQTLE